LFTLASKRDQRRSLQAYIYTRTTDIPYGEREGVTKVHTASSPPTKELDRQTEEWEQQKQNKLCRRRRRRRVE
jgi:hypothetical protein